MAVLLESPHRFPERHLYFGGGGAGKTNCALSVATHMGRGRMHVVENDYTMAWERGIATDFPDAEERVVVHETDMEWEAWTETLAKVCTEADEHAGDWVTVDSITPSWTDCQDWWQEQVYGGNVASHMRELKTAHKDDAKAYGRAVLDTMNWTLVKKEYAAKVLKPLQKWRGNLIITAEAKIVGQDPDDEERMLYGVLGIKPSGYTSLHHLAATNLFLANPGRDKWEMTTIKDRNREKLWHEPVEDFGVDYLMGVAGWKVMK